MKIKVKLFAMIKEKIGRDEIDIEVPSSSKVFELIEEIKKSYPEVSSQISTCRSVVNREYASLETSLKNGDEVALIPPVSGGIYVYGH